MSKFPNRFRALWCPHSSVVAFYDWAGRDVGMMDWTTKTLFKVTGAETHPWLERVVAFYLQNRTEPTDSTMLLPD